MLKLIPNKFFGISVQLTAIFTFLLWPFFDTGEEKNIVKRPALLGVFLILLAAWFALTFWGRYS